jgi:hypothetical protein
VFRVPYSHTVRDLLPGHLKCIDEFLDNYIMYANSEQTDLQINVF